MGEAPQARLEPKPASTSGGLAEWFNAAVLKTVVGQPTGGSNPSPSATNFSDRRLVLPPPVLLERRLGEVAVEARICLLEVGDYLEILASGFGQRDALNVHQTQKLTHGLWHRAPALVSRPTALGDAYARPEVLLIEPQAPPDIPGIGNAFKGFHGR